MLGPCCVCHSVAHPHPLFPPSAYTDTKGGPQDMHAALEPLRSAYLLGQGEGQEGQQGSYMVEAQRAAKMMLRPQLAA
jgi:hypothetical protein